jgi:hypothetical protein
MQGVYTQKPKELAEGEEEDESAPRVIVSHWQADTCISKSAYLVNSAEQ